MNATDGRFCGIYKCGCESGCLYIGGDGRAESCCEYIDAATGIRGNVNICGVGP